jgi:Na+/H+ antiporter NhaD/arsenite permease-like protein
MGVFGLSIEKTIDVVRFSAENPEFLKSVSVASVFFGAMTYIGNAPNFMIKSIAEHKGIKMPGFFEYIYRYSLIILIPLFIFIWLIFF